MPADDTTAATAPPAEPPAQEAPRLKQRAIPDPPEMPVGGRGRLVWFLVVLATAALAAVVAVGTLNAVADPYGSLGTNILPTMTISDRTVKADMIERLTAAPELIVLGSSRSMRYEPRHFEQLTGLRTFNAGVNGIGGTADSWAMTQFMHERFPDSRPAYFWLLDVESFIPFEVQGRTASEPRLAKYVDQATASGDLGELARAIAENRGTVFSLTTAEDSIRLLRSRQEVTVKKDRYRKRILADGVLKERAWSEKEWERRWPQSVARYTELYETSYKELDPTAKEYFERGLAFMNARGATPVIALTPIKPELRELVAPLGWETRHRQVVDYVRSLESKYDFVFIDITDPSTFGADPREFYDGVHMTSVNTRRAIDHVLEQTGGFPP
jgi:hypothetical protein